MEGVGEFLVAGSLLGVLLLDYRLLLVIRGVRLLYLLLDDDNPLSSLLLWAGLVSAYAGEFRGAEIELWSGDGGGVHVER